MGSGEGSDVLHDYRYQEFSITLIIVSRGGVEGFPSTNYALIERGYTTKLPSKTDHPHGLTNYLN